jgi:hypothetical protein
MIAHSRAATRLAARVHPRRPQPEATPPPRTCSPAPKYRSTIETRLPMSDSDVTTYTDVATALTAATFGVGMDRLS